MVVLVQNGCKSFGYLCDHLADWELPLLTSQERIELPIARLKKHQNSKFELHFLLNAERFCPIVK